jgi:hypothetical protein
MIFEIVVIPMKRFTSRRDILTVAAAKVARAVRGMTAIIAHLSHTRLGASISRGDIGRRGVGSGFGVTVPDPGKRGEKIIDMRI